MDVGITGGSVDACDARVRRQFRPQGANDMSELTMARRTEFKRRFLQGSLLMAVAAGTLGVAWAPSMAQKNGDLNMSLHAHDKATAADVGLPLYPGATTYKKDDDDSSSGENYLGPATTSFSMRIE